MALSLDEFCSRLGHLRLDRSGGLVKPYKPLLIAAVVILIHKGKQPSRNVFLDGGLRSAFQQLLELLYPRWPNAAKPEYPFRHLENDGVWTLIPVEGASDALRAAKAVRAEAWDVLRHVTLRPARRGRVPAARDKLRGSLPGASAARTDVLSIGDLRAPVGLSRRRPASRAGLEGG